MQTRSLSLIFLVTVILPGAGPARAQDTSAGMQIAQAWCSDCHLVDPRERKSGRSSAPTFLSIARMKSTTESSLAAFLATPRGRGHMPNVVLSRQEIQDVSAYILSLRKLR